MTEITGPLDIRKHGDDRWTVLRRVTFRSDTGRSVIVKPGFSLDFGSVPQAMWSILPPIGTAADWSFLAHDAIYAWHRDNSEFVIVSAPFERDEADALMLELMFHCGVDPMVAYAAHKAVRLGASYSWLTPAERAERSRKLEEQVFDGY